MKNEHRRLPSDHRNIISSSYSAWNNLCSSETWSFQS